MKYMDKEAFDKANHFGIGDPNDAYAQYFDGNSYVNALTAMGIAPLLLVNVTFEPGTRNHWHAHHAEQGGGQILVCTAGEGWYQEDGKTAQELTEGTVIVIPPGVKHWHGAKADSWFAHIAIDVPGVNARTEWMEAVSEEAYRALG